MSNLPTKKRIVILGGGFGGVATARCLESLCRRRADIEIVLISRDNFVLMTPLLFEVLSGTLDLKSCAVPIRAFLRSAHFIEATIQDIDLDAKSVHLSSAGNQRQLTYDQLVVALGSRTNREMIPGSQHAFTFKTLADALLLRNHVIERFERADVEADPQRKSQLLTFVVVGGGLVGLELLGELTAFVDGVASLYKHIRRDEVRFILLQAGDRVMPEIEPTLATYGARVLAARRGVDIRTATRVLSIEKNKVQLADETIVAETIVLAAGVVPNPVVARSTVDKDKRGCIVVEPTMRCRSHAEVWALGDCASVPGPHGKPYPALAQHALREAKVLAKNIVEVLRGRPAEPFIYDTVGMMGSLGHYMAFGQFLKVRLRGFPAWFMRRTYYLLQMPGWSRRLRIVVDWTFGLLFQPDIVKVGLDSETASLLEEVTRNELILEQLNIGGMSTEQRTGGSPPFHQAEPSETIGKVSS
jgi:NADH dehydrogenase